jgi:hypothetical protein
MEMSSRSASPLLHENQTTFHEVTYTNEILKSEENYVGASHFLHPSPTPTNRNNLMREDLNISCMDKTIANNDAGSRMVCTNPLVFLKTFNSSLAAY